MQKISDITDTADSNGEFTDGNVAGNTQPTELMAAWFTTVQRELIAVLTEAGIKPDKKNDAQLLAALKAILAKAVGGAHYLTVEKNLAEIAGGGTSKQEEARTNLGLKNGAIHNVQSVPTDVTADALLKMGSFGLGIPMTVPSSFQNFNDWMKSATPGIYYLDRPMQNAPESPAHFFLMRNPKGDGVGVLTFGYQNGQIGYDSFLNGKARSWMG